MSNQAIIQHFHHYLDILQQEVEAYTDDQLLWAIVEGINNSGGNLCTHLIGNINHFIGHTIGDTGYKRDRLLEFDCIDIPREDLVKDIQEAKKMIEQVISNIEDLEQPHSSTVFGQSATIHSELLRLITHFTYHIGQVNYHRRILEGVQR